MAQLLTARTGGRAATFRRRAAAAGRLALPPLLVLLLLALLLPLGTGSAVGAVLATGVAVLLIVLVTFGLEATATGLLATGMLLAPMNAVRPVAAITFVTASDVFIALGVIMLLPILMTKGLQKQAPFLLGAFGLFAAGLLSSAGAVAVFSSLNGVTRLVIGALTLPLVFMIWRPGIKVLHLFAGAYVLGNAISVFRGLAFHITSEDGRYAGFTQHPNIMGLASMLSLTIIPFLYFELPSRHRWIAFAGAGSAAAGVWFSGSRAALLAVIACVLIYLLLSRSIEHALIFSGLAIIPLYYVGQALTSPITSTSNPIARLRGGGSATLSDTERTELAEQALHRFLDHPILGSGYANAIEAHNIYLQVAAAGGLIAVVFYVVVLLSTIRQPLVLPQRFRLLALPGLGYALMGPLTPLLWDRYIWCVLALPFLIPRPEPSDDDAQVATVSAGSTA